MLRALIAFFILFPQLVNACTCVTFDSPCDTGWKSGDAILLGKVIALDQLPDRTYNAHLAVAESFRGSATQGQEIVVHTGGGGGDCGYPFAIGTSYVIYAFGMPVDGRLEVNKCSETKPEVMMGGVLRELRAAKNRAPLDDIFGTVGQAPRGATYMDLPESWPRANIEVRAIPTRGSPFLTHTDNNGIYAFPSLPPDTYNVEEDMPGFAPRVPAIAEVKAAGSACRLDNFAKPDGRIEGTVVDAAGQPLAGFVTIQPSDPQEAEAARGHGGMPGFSADSDGKFILPQLSPGRYRLVFHPRVGAIPDFRVTFFWPPPPNDPINLAFGQHIGDIRFKTP